MRRVLRLAVLAGLFVAVLELCARLDEHWRWGASLGGDYSDTQLRVQDELGHHCPPNAQFEKWRLNSFGFRGDEVTEAKPSGVTRILVMGASETFGLYEAAGHEYPAQHLVREVAAARQLPVLDAAQALGKNPDLYADLSHLTDQGLGPPTPPQGFSP